MRGGAGHVFADTGKLGWLKAVDVPEVSLKSTKINRSKTKSSRYALRSDLKMGRQSWNFACLDPGTGRTSSKSQLGLPVLELGHTE
ncbi:hypothetical protein RRG08_046764 [Elysia crispata]|uniref:Uncharacterized protein n=1 Tax=Elysia crispata TaxID=231223 RepID=A0AAE0ZWT9_9GAST|nr:hypothetical protein RRG08_046764 [Elysia crispata]